MTIELAILGILGGFAYAAVGLLVADLLGEPPESRWGPVTALLWPLALVLFAIGLIVTGGDE